MIKCASISIELWLVPNLLLVKKSLQSTAFVTAGLEVDDPPVAGGVAEKPIDDVTSDPVGAPDAQSVLAARFWMRT